MIVNGDNNLLVFKTSMNLALVLITRTSDRIEYKCDNCMGLRTVVDSELSDCET